MLSYWRKVFLIYKKDLREEIRSFDNLLATIFFGVMLVFIFSFAFQLASVEAAQALPAMLWASIFFAATLAMQRSFSKELANDALDGLILATGDSSSIFLAKFFANLSVLCLFELVVVPLLWVFNSAQAVKGVQIGLLALTLFLGNWGLAAIGTLLNGITVQLPTARLLFPILLFPLLTPVLIAVMHCTTAASGQGPGPVAPWLYFLGSFNLMFTAVPLVLFDYILEG